MIIKELIEELKKYDENLLVTISDSEYSPEELSRIKLSHIFTYDNKDFKAVKIDCIILE